MALTAMRRKSSTGAQTRGRLAVCSERSPAPAGDNVSDKEDQAVTLVTDGVSREAVTEL